MKQFVIADIHGNLDILNKAIEAVEAKEASGEIIFTGDYIDRGPDSFDREKPGVGITMKESRERMLKQLDGSFKRLA